MMSFKNKNIIPKEHFEILNLDRNKFLSIEDTLTFTHMSESTSASVLFNKNIKKHMHQYSDSFRFNHKRINVKPIIKEKCKSNNTNNKSKFLVNFNFGLSINECKRFDAFGNQIDKNKKHKVSFIDQIFDINNNNINDKNTEINNVNINNNNNNENNTNNNNLNNNDNKKNNNNLVEYDNIESFKLYNKQMSYKYNLKEEIGKKQICCSTCILF